MQISESPHRQQHRFHTKLAHESMFHTHAQTTSLFLLSLPFSLSLWKPFTLCDFLCLFFSFPFLHFTVTLSDSNTLFVTLYFSLFLTSLITLSLSFTHSSFLSLFLISRSPLSLSFSFLQILSFSFPPFLLFSSLFHSHTHFPSFFLSSSHHSFPLCLILTQTHTNFLFLFFLSSLSFFCILPLITLSLSV